MNVEAIDAKRVALRFFTTGPSEPISGTVALYAGDRRYDVAFHNAYARTRPATEQGDVVPVVVRFPGPVDVDGAIITAVDSPPRPACREHGTPFLPWKFPRGSEPAQDRAFRERVDALTPLDAPPPVLLPHTCPVRNAHARTVAAASPRGLGTGNGGTAAVLVSVDTNDRVADARIVRSSGDEKQDAVALQTARLSAYETEIFNCEKRANDYIFTVEF